MFDIRIGQSRDIHRLDDNKRKFIVGGVIIPHTLGLVSHSDGDCLYHAIAESLLGALALGDLGKHFPDNTDEYLDYDSSLIVKSVMEMVKEKGYIVKNIDCSIILERPKLAPHIDAIRNNVASLLEIEIDRVSIKAQTNEKCGEIGQGKAIECTSIVLLVK